MKAHEQEPRVAYKTIDDWLDEVAGFGIRRERMPVNAMEWVHEAWTLGAAAGRAALGDGQ